MSYSIKYLFKKCEQIRMKLTKSIIQNFIFFAGNNHQLLNQNKGRINAVIYYLHYGTRCSSYFVSELDICLKSNDESLK